MANRIDDNQENILGQAVQQFIDARLQGREPDLNEFVKQYPQLELQIRRKIRNLGKIDTLFDSLLKADEGDFEDETAGQDLVGRKIGNFEIVEMIGRGGMGVVYLARDTRLKRSVAIKCIPAGLTGDSTAKTRFMREAELLASLNHPNIAVIHEIIEEDKSGYLILEYVPGQTLSEHIAHQPLELEEVLSIGQQIADAVSAAHKKGVIHRDLKPDNIKITPEGRVKVLDFGLAKPSVSESERSDVTATEPGRIIGTPAYMSPEQARGKSIDHRTDIWSFGCIMYQMLTGHYPFEGQTATDTLVHIIEHQPDWEALPKKTPENIRVLLRRCLEKDPDKRLGDIADAAGEISKTLSKSAVAQVVAKSAKTSKVPMIIGLVAVIIVLFIISLKFILQKEIQPSPKEIRLVVLPFENLGPADDEWFADGMTDEITSRLAGIHGLGVISRQSAIQYKNKEKSTPQIAKELGVDYILEGTIQREQPSDPNSRVKIRPQLIRVANDTHVWADIYENNMGKVFHIQSEVAESVVQALDIALFEMERQTLRSEPTKNMEAYVYYLRGIDYSSRQDHNKDNLIIAIEMYEMAIKLDDKFALAHARLSVAHSGMYHFSHDRSKERIAMAWEESEKALNLDPELPEAHWARGLYHYWGRSEYELALKELEIARKSQPNNSRFLASIGHVQRRQGKFNEALANYKRALELDPQSRAGTIATTLLWLRRYQEAEHYYERAISLAPNEDFNHFVKAILYLMWKGSTVEARSVLDRASKYFNLEDKQRFVNLLFELDIFERNYQGALDRLFFIPEDLDKRNCFVPNVLRYARIYEYMNKKELAEKYYNKARIILEAKIQQDPNDDRFHSALGIAYAGLGRKEDAVHEGRRAVKLIPYTKDIEKGFARATDLAYIYTMVGEYDAAVDQIEFLLSVPGELSIPLLQIDPAWDPLRKHPRFQKLINLDK
jgi:serine/threonine protein kinase/tetratricopeptide (TPR) repeat protein